MILLWDPGQAHSLLNLFEAQFPYKKAIIALFNPEDYSKAVRKCLSNA